MSVYPIYLINSDFGYADDIDQVTDYSPHWAEVSSNKPENNTQGDDGSDIKAEIEE